MRLNEFRAFLASNGMNGMIFNTFPKDALAKKHIITGILKTKDCASNAYTVPKGLLKHEPQLKGSLRVSDIKHFDKKEVSKSGVSKEGWRMLFMEASDSFMETLRPFPESHAFYFGYTKTIQLHGGIRAKEEKKKAKTHSSRYDYLFKIPTVPPPNSGPSVAKGSSRSERKSGKRPSLRPSSDDHCAGDDRRPDGRHSDRREQQPPSSDSSRHSREGKSRDKDRSRGKDGHRDRRPSSDSRHKENKDSATAPSAKASAAQDLTMKKVLGLNKMPMATNLDRDQNGKSSSSSSVRK